MCRLPGEHTSRATYRLLGGTRVDVQVTGRRVPVAGGVLALRLHIHVGVVHVAGGAATGSTARRLRVLTCGSGAELRRVVVAMLPCRVSCSVVGRLLRGEGWGSGQERGGGMGGPSDDSFLRAFNV